MSEESHAGAPSPARGMSVAPVRAEATAMSVLFALSFAHMLNDTLQSLIPAIYPVIKESYHLSYAQIGMITFVSQLSGSLLQPVVGIVTDRRPMPWSLAIGMGFSLCGITLLGLARSYEWILCAVGITGIGSSIFHPEASRLARLASGGKHGLAQSLFQVGGNFGTSLGPVLAAVVIAPYGQRHVLWFLLVAGLGIMILSYAGRWYQRRLLAIRAQAGSVVATVSATRLPAKKIALAVAVLVMLVFSKQVYLASMLNYYTFYLKARFDVTTETSQWLLFLFLFSVAAGTIIGGPVGDKIGRKKVIWISILGVAPFTLALPHVGFALTVALSVVIGLVLASAFSAILVFAQELIPGKVGLVAGLFFGLAFGFAGVASALLGKIADATSIGHVFLLCSFLPLIGLVTGFLPDREKKR